MKLSCLICDKELEQCGPDDDIIQPWAGTCFETRGHYGSTIFDPMDGTKLEIIICDGCLREKSKTKGLIYHIKPVYQKVKYKITRWKP